MFLTKLTQNEVVAQFEAIEKERCNGYTFTNVVYKNNKTKVFITCSVEDHGDFLITPAAYKTGGKCSKCCSTTFTTKEVVAQFEAIELIKKRGYTFQNVDYVNSYTKVSITCNVEGHGDFLMKLNSFKKGQGCSKCAIEKSVKPQEVVIAQLEKIEKTKKRGYTFQNAVYTHNSSKMAVTCNIENHGDFYTTLRNFQHGSGCPICASILLSNEKRLTQEIVIDQFEEIEKIKQRGYTFKNVKYVDSKTKVSITCNVEGHGDFLMAPANFKSGSGCQKCSLVNNKTKDLLSQEHIINALQSIEKVKQCGYTFENLVYVNAKTKFLVTCPIEGHGDFPTTKHILELGCGCPKCNIGGFKKDKPGIFYYVRVNKDGCEAYKLGITNHSVKKRYPKDFAFMTVLRTIEFELGQEAYDFEQSVLNDYAYAKWTGRPLLPNNGNTELMKYDILGWDN